MEPIASVFNKVRHEIECYLKLAFPVHYDDLKCKGVLSQFIDTWELSYISYYKKEEKNPNHGRFSLNKNDHKYFSQTSALRKVYGMISERFTEKT